MSIDIIESIHNSTKVDLINPAVQTFTEEVLNTLSHIIGLVLCIPAVFFLLSVARMRGTKWHLVSCSIYGLSLMTMYFCSSLYHSVGVFYNLEKYRNLFKDLDHCAIYMLIAGTYTPLTLINLVHNHRSQKNASKLVKLGWALFGVVWSMCFIGVLGKLILGTDSIPEYVSNIFYLMMGWVSLLGIRDMIRVLPRKGLWLLVAGGISYTSGVAFLIWDELDYNHAVWHLFVAAGSVLHYFCILECILPASPKLKKDGLATKSLILEHFDWAEQQLKLAFFGSGKRRSFIISYMNTLYSIVIGWLYRYFVKLPDKQL